MFAVYSDFLHVTILKQTVFLFVIQAASEEIKTIWVREIRKLLTGQLEACRGIKIIMACVESFCQRGLDYLILIQLIILNEHLKVEYIHSFIHLSYRS